MKNSTLYIFIIFIFAYGCKNENKTNQDLTSVEKDLPHESFFDVPIENTALIINIDTLTLVKKNENHEDKIYQNIDSLNNNYSLLNHTIKDKIIDVLNRKKFNYSLISKFDKEDFSFDLIDPENSKNINFDELKSKYKQDFLTIINVKKGFTNDVENKNQCVAKTDLYINVLDLKNKKVNFTETISGTKYFNNHPDSINTKNLEKNLLASINETIEIIDNN